MYWCYYVLCFLFVVSVFNFIIIFSYFRSRVFNSFVCFGKFDFLSVVFLIMFFFILLLNFIVVLCCVFDVFFGVVVMILGKGNLMWNFFFLVKLLNMIVYNFFVF